jgi:hypothetical protein
MVFVPSLCMIWIDGREYKESEVSVPGGASLIQKVWRVCMAECGARAELVRIVRVGLSSVGMESRLQLLLAAGA